MGHDAGWRNPLTFLNIGFNGQTDGTLNGPNIGLMAEVKRRIDALRPDKTTNDTPTRIFVIGHSRGGALVGHTRALDPGHTRQLLALHDYAC